VRVAEVSGTDLQLSAYRRVTHDRPSVSSIDQARSRSSSAYQRRRISRLLGLSWPAHQHQRRLDPSPGFGLLLVTRSFKRDRLLRSLSDCLGTVRFQELAGVFLDFGCMHGVTLLIVGATGKTNPST
jgi:hypothetical protein